MVGSQCGQMVRVCSKTALSQRRHPTSTGTSGLSSALGPDGGCTNNISEQGCEDKCENDAQCDSFWYYRPEGGRCCAKSSYVCNGAAGGSGCPLRAGAEYDATFYKLTCSMQAQLRRITESEPEQRKGRPTKERPSRPERPTKERPSLSETAQRKSKAARAKKSRKTEAFNAMPSQAASGCNAGEHQTGTQQISSAEVLSQRKHQQLLLPSLSLTSNIVVQQKSLSLS